MRILITGGAGYIGTKIPILFYERDYKAEALDNLLTINDWAIKYIRHRYVHLLDKNYLRRVFLDNKFDAVIHFAGKSLVAESKKAKKELTRGPLYNDIVKIIGSSWKFHKYYE